MLVPCLEFERLTPARSSCRREPRAAASSACSRWPKTADQSYCSATRRRPASPMRRALLLAAEQAHDRVGERGRRVGDEHVASLASTGSPSAPMVVETTGLPMAIASKIFSRVPPPIRSGTM